MTVERTMRPVTASGNFGQGFFRTPRHIIEAMVDKIGIGHRAILEPSAGDGAIVSLLLERGANPANIYCVETQDRLADHLIEIYRVKVENCDFMIFDPNEYGMPGMKFQRIFMSPPMEDNQDTDHILRAYGMLEAGGAMAAIVSDATFHRTDSQVVPFLNMIKTAFHAEQVMLDEDDFAEVNRRRVLPPVRARMLFIYKIGAQK